MAGKRENEEEDWYSRWERQKKLRYEEFMKRVEDDPFSALFGKSNRWLGWTDFIHPRANESKDAESYPAAFTTKMKKDAGKESKNEVNNTSGGKESRTRSSRSTDVSEEEAQEYDIDPITLRKVPKKPSQQDSSIKTSASTSHQTHDIPVKKFTMSNHMPWEDVSGKSDKAAETARNHATKLAQSWLAQEGFGGDRGDDAGVDRAAKTKDSGQTTQDSVQRSGGDKVESALDRHVKNRESKQRPVPEYEPQENKAEDVDLLRASDVRASAGLRGRSAKQNAAEKQARQKNLEEQYEARTSDMEDRLAQELAKEDEEKSTRSADEGPTVHGPESAWPNPISDPESEKPAGTAVVVEMSESVETPSQGSSTPLKNLSTAAKRDDMMNKIKAKVVPLKAHIDTLTGEYEALRRRWLEQKRLGEAARRKSRRMLEDEVEKQQAAMEALEMRSSRTTDASNEVKPTLAPEETHGEGDMASNVHEFAGRARWYKRRAPHANREMDGKLERLAKEKVFIREIRKIYEDAYGTIDTKHRQSPDITPNPSATSVAQSTTGEPSQPLSIDSHLSNLVTQDHTFTQDQVQSEASGNSQVTEAFAIVQKLYNQLHHAHSILQDQRTQSNQFSESNESINMLPANKLYQKTVAELVKASLRLANPAMPGDVLKLNLEEDDSKAAAETGTQTDAKSSVHPESIATNTDQPADVDSDKTTTDDHQADTKRAESKTTSTPSTTKSPPSYYRILAYDSPAQRVTAAKTTSIAPFTGEKPLTPLEALNLLQNPGKFLPHLMSLHNKGYEIVSGAKDILFLKKLHADEQPPPSEEGSKHDEDPHRPNPIDGTTSPSVASVAAGNFASLTGYVNHDPINPVPEGGEDQRPPPPDNKAKVTREEAVFSGSSRRVWEEGQGRRMSKRDKRAARRRRSFRQVLATGVMTAGMCYAVGVGLEMWGS